VFKRRRSMRDKYRRSARRNRNGLEKEGKDAETHTHTHRKREREETGTVDRSSAINAVNPAILRDTRTGTDAP